MGFGVTMIGCTFTQTLVGASISVGCKQCEGGLLVRLYLLCFSNIERLKPQQACIGKEKACLYLHFARIAKFPQQLRDRYYDPLMRKMHIKS